MKKIILIIIIFIIFLFPNPMKAKKISCNNENYQALLEIEKEKLNINETTNIKVTSEYQYNITYTINNNKVVSVKDDGLVKGLQEGKTIINALIKFLDGDVEISNCSLSLEVEVVSNDALLKSLNIEEYDISDIFSPSKYEYTINLPYNIDKINITATPNNDKAIITGIGRRYLEDGENTFEVHVIATNGTTKSYKIIVNRDKPNNDSSLKNLIIEGYILNPKFNQDIFKYELNIDKEIDNIIIKAEPNDKKATTSGTGEFTLASGDNIFNIVVTAEDQTKSNYEINIHKNNGSSKLKTLEIEDYKLNEDFNSDKYTYHLTIGSKTDSIKINATTVDEDTYEIIGNSNLKIGNNEVIIKVTGKDKTTTTYKLLVNKLTNKEEDRIEKNNKLSKILLIMFIIAIVFMSISIGIFIKRNYKKRKR